MKNSNDTIGNGTRDFPVCTAVPQLTAPLRIYTYIMPLNIIYCVYYIMYAHA